VKIRLLRILLWILVAQLSVRPTTEKLGSERSPVADSVLARFCPIAPRLSRQAIESATGRDRPGYPGPAARSVAPGRPGSTPGAPAHPPGPDTYEPSGSSPRPPSRLRC